MTDLPMLRCDICGCAVSQVKSVFVCERCQEGELKPGDPGYDWTDIFLARLEIKSLRARVAELEAAQRWIPVTERLPEDDTVILGLFMEYSRPQICAFRRYGKGWIEENDGDTYHSGITHWMPLPQPPKEVDG